MRKVRANRVLELNPQHPAFAALTSAYENDKEKAKKLSQVLEGMAELLAGVELEDPAAFTALVGELF